MTEVDVDQIFWKRCPVNMNTYIIIAPSLMSNLVIAGFISLQIY